MAIKNPSVEAYINAAINILKSEYENETMIAGYNGIVTLLTCAKELDSMNKAASNAINQNFSKVLQQAHDMYFVLEMLCKDDDWQVYDAVDEDFKNIRDIAKNVIRKNEAINGKI